MLLCVCVFVSVRVPLSVRSFVYFSFFLFLFFCVAPVWAQQIRVVQPALRALAFPLPAASHSLPRNSTSASPSVDAAFGEACAAACVFFAFLSQLLFHLLVSTLVYLVMAVSVGYDQPTASGSCVSLVATRFSSLVHARGCPRSRTIGITG